MTFMKEQDFLRFANQSVSLPTGLHWEVFKLWREIRNGIAAAARKFHLQSLALKYCLTLGHLEELTGRRLDPIHIIGGGTKNHLLNQLTADCTGREVVTGPVEATAIGNILMQAITLGHLRSLAEARAVVRSSLNVETYHPTRQDG
jgi:sugar (pentulose or hexulose) kinase